MLDHQLRMFWAWSWNHSWWSSVLLRSTVRRLQLYSFEINSSFSKTLPDHYWQAFNVKIHKKLGKTSCMCEWVEEIFWLNSRNSGFVFVCWCWTLTLFKTLRIYAINCQDVLGVHCGYQQVRANVNNGGKKCDAPSPQTQHKHTQQNTMRNAAMNSLDTEWQ